MAQMSDTNDAHQAVLDATAAARRNLPPQRVPVRMYETPGALVVVAPMAAVQADDVTVEMHGSKLRFFAEIRSAPERDYLLDEWEYGGYERDLEVPPGYGGGLEAALHNGQLVIRVLPGQAADSAVRRLHPST
jgi:HSP20 family molecular chaperone IbpA